MISGAVQIVLIMVFYPLVCTVAALAFLYKASPLWNKWIKCVLYVLYCFATAILIPLMLFRGRDSRNALLPLAGLKRLCNMYGLTYSVEGHENIVKNSGSVVLINHQSMLDLSVLACLWPTLPKCSVISKKEIFFYGTSGLVFWLCGVMFIDRSKPSEAHKALNKTAEIIRKNESRILMYPEGSRNGGEKLLPFKKGAFHLAVASQCPLQPIAVSRYTFLKPDRFEDGHIKIRILPPISTKNCTVDDIPKLMEESSRVMQENIDQLSNTQKS